MAPHRWERANEDYDKAIGLGPTHARAYSIRGFSYNGLAQYQRAILDLD